MNERNNNLLAKNSEVLTSCVTLCRKILQYICNGGFSRKAILHKKLMLRGVV